MGPWPLLGLAIVSEVIGTTALRASTSASGSSRNLWYLVVVGGYLASFWLLAQVLKRLELGIAYAVWAGVGTAVMALIGIAIFGEGVSAVKFGCIALIIGGVVGLNLSSAHI